MALEELIGPKALTERMECFRARFLSAGPEAEHTPLANAGQAETRDEIARGKGPWVLHVLRHVIGDRAFRSLLRDFLASYRSQGADLKSFETHARDHGEHADLARFFRDWFWRTESSSLLAEGGDAQTMAHRYRRQTAS